MRKALCAGAHRRNVIDALSCAGVVRPRGRTAAVKRSPPAGGVLPAPASVFAFSRRTTKKFSDPPPRQRDIFKWLSLIVAAYLLVVGLLGLFGDTYTLDKCELTGAASLFFSNGHATSPKHIIRLRPSLMGCRHLIVLRNLSMALR